MVVRRADKYLCEDAHDVLLDFFRAKKLVSDDIEWSNCPELDIKWSNYSELDFENKLKQILYFTNDVPNECPHCDNGTDKILLIELSDDEGYIIIKNWSGCLTYDASFTVEFYKNILDATQKFGSIDYRYDNEYFCEKGEKILSYFFQSVDHSYFYMDVSWKDRKIENIEGKFKQIIGYIDEIFTKCNSCGLSTEESKILVELKDNEYIDIKYTGKCVSHDPYFIINTYDCLSEAICKFKA